MNSENLSILVVCIAAIAMLVLSNKYATRWPLIILALSVFGSIFYAIMGHYLINSADELVIGYLLTALAVIWFPLILLVMSFSSITLPYGQIPWWKFLARSILGIIISILILAGLSVLFNILGLMLFVFSGIAIFRYWLAVRYNRALEIISTLTAAIRQNLPLPSALQAAALGRKDKAAWIFRNIAHWLTQGNTLAESIRKGYPRCLPQILTAIEAAENINQLPQTLLSLEKDLINDTDETRKVRPVHPWYPFIVLFFVMVLTTGLLIFIVPTFSHVISEMSEGRQHLPAATQFLVNLSHTLINWKVALFAAGSVISIYLVWSYYIFRSRISYKPGPFLNLIDRIRWFAPIQSRLEQNSSTLRLIELLRPALSAGLPMPQAIAVTLGTNINICFKNRISRWLGYVENGRDIAQSARDCGIGHSIAWALDAKINPGQAPILLEMLEENCRNKHNYLGNVIRSILWPMVILALGAFVGFVVYAMYIPMVQIIIIGVQNVNP